MAGSAPSSLEFLRPKRQSLSFDMAPLIDVVFQLLIFFMLSSWFLAPAMKLNLPKAVSREEREPQSFVVNVDRDGRIFVDKTEIRAEELERAVRAALASGKIKSVDLRGDEEMPYKHFVKVMSAAKAGGARQINIVHQKGDES